MYACKVCKTTWTHKEHKMRLNTQICSRICADEMKQITGKPTYWCMSCLDGRLKAPCNNCTNHKEEIL